MIIRILLLLGMLWGPYRVSGVPFDEDEPRLLSPGFSCECSRGTVQVLDEQFFLLPASAYTLAIPDSAPPFGATALDGDIRTLLPAPQLTGAADLLDALALLSPPESAADHPRDRAVSSASVPFPSAFSSDVFPVPAAPTFAEPQYALSMPKYGLSAAQVRRMSADRRVALVDVRDAGAFERVSLPGSLNIPLFAVKTKTYLRSQALILLDVGYSPGLLQAACEDLRRLGFEAWFLMGGVAAMKASGETLAGDVFARQSVNRVPAAQWLADDCPSCWLVVDASAVEHAPTMPGVQQLWLPFDATTPHEFVSGLSGAVSRVSGPGGDGLLLIVTEDGQEYADIERRLQREGLPPVFFLEGGIAAYQHAIARRQQMLQGRQATPTPCAPCSR